VGYWTYYLLWTFFVYFMHEPWLFAGVLVLLFVQRFLPRPDALFRALRHARRLRTEVEINPANVTARRNLARVYLDVLRPRAALSLLEQALARAPDDAEIQYLSGLALTRVGRHEDALPRLVRAVELDPRVGFGLPYRVAGDALYALKRWDGAIDAYERYASSNSSDVGVHTRLAHAHYKAGERDEVKRCLAEALDAFRYLRGASKRRSFRRYLEAQWARIWLLQEPGPMLGALVVLAMIGGAGWVAYRAFDQPSARAAANEEDEDKDEDERSALDSVFSGSIGQPLLQAAVTQILQDKVDDQQRALDNGQKLCGTQQTGDFRGHYTMLREDKDGGAPSAQINTIDDAMYDQYANLDVQADRILTGPQMQAEFCLTRVIERTPEVLRSEALFSFMRNVPGQALVVQVRLQREASGLMSLSFGDRDQAQAPTLVMRYRKAE
jgi:tetratricopeptide (TPR) repeat protein